jgi:phosphoglycerate dehydrogenase-like enzyme
MPKIYVTEPDTIDITCAQSILKGTDYELVAGDSHFENASDEYEAVLIRTATQIDSTIKQYFPNLKAVIRVGTGLDNVDLTYCKENGVAIYNAPGANADAVAEYVATMALSALRKLYMLEKSDVEQWDRFKFRGRSIIDVTVGIVGFGNVGRLVYRKLRGMGCHSFLAYDPYLTTEFMESPEGVQAVALDALFSQADVISLHVPLTDETKYTIKPIV